MNLTDLIVVLVVSILCLSIALGLYFAYKNNPCGMCSEASRCSKKKRAKPSLVKHYYKCYGHHKKIQNIFLDFNGTILDDLNLCHKILNDLCQIANIPPISVEEYIKIFGFPVKNYYESAGFDFNKMPYSFISEHFNNNYSKRWRKETKLFKNFKKYIKKLKAEGFQIYIITASETELVNAQLKYFKIDKFFDGIASSSNKEANGKLEYTLDFIKKNNITISKTIMMGDTLHDAEVARKIGVNCVLFSKGHNDIDRLNSTGLPVFSSYSEFYNYIEENR